MTFFNIQGIDMKAVFFAVVAGLAFIAPAFSQSTKSQAPVPVCAGPDDCEAMWIDSQEVIQLAVQMKIRISSANRIETFTDRTFGMTGVVTKYPMGADAYEMRAQILCRNELACADLRPSAVNMFNGLVNNYADYRKSKSIK